MTLGAESARTDTDYESIGRAYVAATLQGQAAVMPPPSGTHAQTLAPGARGLAAFDEAKARFEANPLGKYEYVRGTIQKALRIEGNRPTAIEAYFEKFVPFTDNLTPFLMTLLCEIISALEENRTARALGVAAAGIQFLEQRALDGDASLEVAWAGTLLEEPLVKPRPAPKVKPHGRRAYATTLERPTLTAVCAALRDWEALDRLRRGLPAEK